MVQFQEETRSSVKNLESQVSQITGAVTKLEARNSGKPKTKMNVSVITLRSGNEMMGNENMVVQEKEPTREPVSEVEPSPPSPSEKVKKPSFHPYDLLPPFPEALRDTQR